MTVHINRSPRILIQGGTNLTDVAQAARGNLLPHLDQGDSVSAANPGSDAAGHLVNFCAIWEEEISGLISRTEGVATNVTEMGTSTLAADEYAASIAQGILNELSTLT